MSSYTAPLASAGRERECRYQESPSSCGVCARKNVWLKKASCLLVTVPGPVPHFQGKRALFVSHAQLNTNGRRVETDQAQAAHASPDAPQEEELCPSTGSHPRPLSGNEGGKVRRIGNARSNVLPNRPPSVSRRRSLHRRHSSLSSTMPSLSHNRPLIAFKKRLETLLLVVRQGCSPLPLSWSRSPSRCELLMIFPTQRKCQAKKGTRQAMALHLMLTLAISGQQHGTR